MTFTPVPPCSHERVVGDQTQLASPTWSGAPYPTRPATVTLYCLPLRSFHFDLYVDPSRGIVTFAICRDSDRRSSPFTGLPTLIFFVLEDEWSLGGGVTGTGVGTAGGGSVGVGVGGMVGGGGGVGVPGGCQVGSLRWYQLVSPAPPARDSEMCTWLRCRSVAEHFAFFLRQLEWV